MAMSSKPDYVFNGRVSYISNLRHEALPGVPFTDDDTLELTIEPGFEGCGLLDRGRCVPVPKTIRVNGVTLTWKRIIAFSGKAYVAEYEYTAGLRTGVAVKFRKLEKVMGEDEEQEEPTDGKGLKRYQESQEGRGDGDLVAQVAVMTHISENAFLGKPGLHWDVYVTGDASILKTYEYAISFMELLGDVRDVVKSRYTKRNAQGRMVVQGDDRKEFMEFVKELGVWLLSIAPKLSGYADFKWENMGVLDGNTWRMIDLESLCHGDKSVIGILVSRCVAEGYRLGDWNHSDIDKREIATPHPDLCGLLLKVKATSSAATLKNFDPSLRVPGLAGFLLREVELSPKDPVTPAQQDAIDLLEAQWNQEIRRALGTYERHAIAMILLDLMVNCGSNLLAASWRNAGEYLANNDICYKATSEQALARLRELFDDVREMKDTDPEIWAMVSELHQRCFGGDPAGDGVVRTPESDQPSLPAISGPRSRTSAPEPKRCKRGDSASLMCLEDPNDLGVGHP